MSDNVLQKYLSAKPSAVESSADLEVEGLDDLGAFGFLRGVHDRAIMLELRHRDGKISAVGYAWLSGAEFDPSEGITLNLGARQVKITGRNLNTEVRPNIRLFSAIIRHRVPWIQEADASTSIQVPKAGVLVDGIQIK